MAKDKQRLMVIDCVGNPKGFRHSVHQVNIKDKERTVETIDTTFISQPLPSEWHAEYMKDPTKFIQEMQAEPAPDIMDETP